MARAQDRPRLLRLPWRETRPHALAVRLPNFTTPRNFSPPWLRGFAANFLKIAGKMQKRSRSGSTGTNPRKRDYDVHTGVSANGRTISGNNVGAAIPLPAVGARS